MINLLRFRAWWREVVEGMTIFGLPLTKDSLGWDGETILARLTTIIKKQPDARKSA